jgi:multiple sugar transport system ATP-binding protein
MMARVQLVNVSKQFGQTLAVTDLNLEIMEGEFLTLLGGSGCGKSTTLHLIAGLESPSSGHILFDDEDVTALSPRERNVAVVFQNYALYPHKTVAENLAFPLVIARMAKTDISTRVQEIARLLQIEAVLERKPRELSGGQQQRVALGRALIRRPRVFLLDEPLSNLDARLRVTVRHEIKTLHHTIGTTLVYVTHDQEEAMALSDRIAVMHAGKIEQCGPPQDLYHTPASLTVAELVGSPPINTIDVEVRGMTLVLPGGIEAPIPPVQAERFVGVPERLRLGIRPEHILLTSEESFSHGTVRRVEYLGKDTHLLLDCGVFTLTVRAEADLSVQPGQATAWSWKWDYLLCFNPQDGKNIQFAA